MKLLRLLFSVVAKCPLSITNSNCLINLVNAVKRPTILWKACLKELPTPLVTYSKISFFTKNFDTI